MSRPDSTPDPLGPLAFIVKGLTGLVGVFLVIRAIQIATGSAGALGFGADSDACITSDGAGLPLTQGAYRDLLSHGPSGAEQGVAGLADTFRVCAPHADFGARFAASMPGLVTLLFVIGFLALSHLLIRRARLSGLFTARVADLVTVLGGYLLVGSIVTTLGSMLGRELFLYQVSRDYGWAWELPNLSWPTVVAGFGVLALGRVMHIAVSMQDDIDATI